MTSDLSGQEQRPLFPDATASGRRRRQSCTCGSAVTPGALLSLDLSSPNDNGVIYFVSSDGSGDIWTTDLEGCQCQRVVDAATLTDSGEFSICDVFLHQ